jgi:hypothetical protein
MFLSLTKYILHFLPAEILCKFNFGVQSFFELFIPINIFAVLQYLHFKHFFPHYFLHP